MRPEYRQGLDVLDPSDIRWETAASSAGFNTDEERNMARTMGLGSAIVARRAKLKAASKVRKARRRHSRRTR